MTGMTVDTVRGMVEKGHLPSAKFGKRRLINLALVHQQCLAQEFENF
ncbi:MAG: DNA-binding protein [Gammaproteobacteria bacterium]|nr:MAG: DNA-binding protein [Gammaproteobacteria bacterium]